MTVPLIDAVPPELREQLEAARRGRYEALGTDAVDWLALVPQWTIAVAKRCGFPTRGEEVTDFVARAARAGVCEVRGDGDAAAFWMPGHVRREYVDTLLGTAILGVAQDIAERLRSVDEVTGGLERWAELASNVTMAARRLSSEVVRCTRDGDSGEALDWLAAAEPLAAVLRGELEEAMARGRRRVGLLYRRIEDERALENNVELSGPLDALRQLLRDPGGPWMMHFVGMGGVGKTMLVRYLTVRMAGELKRDTLAVGRVDFDHLDAAYPWERPSELLVALADSLLIHSDRDESFDDLIEAVRRADEQRTRGMPADLKSPAMQHVLDCFARLLEDLPEPVVLVLDTCEELAKHRPPAGEQVTSVDKTFEILAEVHSRVPGVAAMLAGRRMLASAGHGWEADPAGRGALVSLESQPSLGLHEMRGFTRENAVELLSDRDHHGLEIGDDLLEAILVASPEVGRVPGAPRGEDDGEPRYNPYDIELFARWYESSNGELDADQIRKGGRDGYVKARIVDRVTEREAQAVLPAVVLLGRFDAAMLTPAVDGGAAEVEAAMRALARLEWIDAVEGDGPAAWVLQVEPHLLERLRAWFRRSEYHALEAAADRLGDGLASLLKERQPDRLAVERIEASLRCWTPERAAELWPEVQRGLAERPDGGWAAGDAAAERVLGIEPTLRALTSPLVRALVTATQAAGSLHLGRLQKAQGSWQEVEELTREREGPQAHRLRDRATVMPWVIATNRAGLMRVRPGLADKTPLWNAACADSLDRMLQTTDEDGTGLAVLAAALDHGEGQPGDPWPDPMTVLAWARTAQGPSGSVRAVTARWLLWSGRPDADEWFGEMMPGESSSTAAPQLWADWLEPASPLDRQRLEVMIRECDAGAPRLHEDWAAEAMQRERTVDGERVLSLSLEVARVAGAADPVDVEELRDFALTTAGPPSCRAHLRVPPLFVSVARALAARGELRQALELVTARGEYAAGTRTADDADVADATAAGLAVLELTRAARLEEGYGRRAARDAAYTTGPTYAAAVAAIALTLAPEDYPATAPQDTADAYAWERALPPGGPREGDRERSVQVLRTKGSEEERLLRATGRHRRGSREDHVDWWIEGLDVLVARGRSRAPVLEPESLPIRARAIFPSGDAAGLEGPPGVVARALIDEWELIALWQPAEAVAPLEAAAERCLTAHDTLGELRAATAACLASLRAGDRAAADRTHARAVGVIGRTLTPADASEWLREPAAVPDEWRGFVDRLDLASRWMRGEQASGTSAECRRLPSVDAADGTPETSSVAPAWSLAIGGAVLALLAWLLFGWEAAAVVVGVSALLIVSLLVLPLYGPAVWRLVNITCRIVPHDDGSAAHLTLDARMRVRWLPVSGSRADADLRLVDGLPSADPNPVTDSLATATRLPGRPVIGLDVEHSLQRGDWEAALLLAGDLEPSLRRLPDFYRVRRDVGLDLGRPPAASEKVLVRGSDRWSLLAETGWQKWRAVEVGGVSPPPSEAATVHLIGSPALTATGWHLRLDDDPRTSATKGAVTKAAEGREVLLAPETMGLRDTSLVVLQGAPGLREAEFSRGLRAFAAELNRAGAPVVLVLPAVPPRGATRAVEAVAANVPIEDAGRRHLLAAARAARKAILDYCGEEHITFTDGLGRTPLEYVLEVCLFITDSGPGAR